MRKLTAPGLCTLCAVIALCVADPARAAATITVLNSDPAGVGFNDPTPAAPVGGNPGTTLGQQRLFAAAVAANRWGAVLTSTVSIVVQETFTVDAACTGELGLVQWPAGGFANFSGAPFPDTIYLPSLANKLAGIDLQPNAPDFTLDVCEPPGTFYLGLDNNHGAQLDLVTHYLHLLAHGLGFWNATAAGGGAYFGGIPFMWDHFVFDNSTNKLWVDMTQPERLASAQNPGHLVWTGPNVTAAVPNVYGLAPKLTISGPEAGAEAGDVVSVPAGFGTLVGAVPVTGQLMPADACPGLSPVSLDALAVQGNVALIAEDAACSDVVQAKNAQLSGAIAVVLIDDTAEAPPPAPTGFDATLTIPVVAISAADGAALLPVLQHRGRRASGVRATLAGDPTRRLGADSVGRALLYATPTFSQTGPSHWDPSARPNQLMEPSQAPDLTQAINLPNDLTYELLKDLGW